MVILLLLSVKTLSPIRCFMLSFSGGPGQIFTFGESLELKHSCLADREEQLKGVGGNAELLVGQNGVHSHVSAQLCEICLGEIPNLAHYFQLRKGIE